MATTPQAVSEVCICLRIPGTAVWAVSHSSHLCKCAEAAFSCRGRFAHRHAVITQMQPFIPATKALQYSTKPKGSLLSQYCGMCADKEGKETKPEARTLSRFLQSSFHKLKFLNSCKSCMTNWHATKIASRDTGCVVKIVIRHNRRVGLSSERGASTT